MTEQSEFEEWFSKYQAIQPLQNNHLALPSYLEVWQACAERNVLNIERIRELIGYLISMASLNDEQMAKQFADELEELLPKINPVLPGETE